jgi:predicted transposase YdaD
MIDFDEMLREHRQLIELEDRIEEKERLLREMENRSREMENRSREVEKRSREAEKRFQESARNLKALGLPDEQIAAAMGLSLEEVARA